MHFRTKIIMTYSILVLALAFVVGIVFGNYNKSRVKKSEYESLDMLTEKTVRQLEETIKPMEFISEYLLSDSEVLDALVTLATTTPDNIISVELIKEAQKTIQLRLNSYYILKNFHRVLVYNEFGYVLASQNYGHMKVNEDKDLNNISWLTEVSGKNGRSILINAHEDDWGIINKKNVFCVAREIIGLSMGYIEVQQKTSVLDEVFSIGIDDIDVIIVQSNGDLFYSSKILSNKESEYYTSLVDIMHEGTKEYNNPISKETEIISSLFSNKADATVLLVKNQAAMIDAVRFTTTTIASITTLILVVSLIYIFIFSDILTRPLRQLRQQMEKTQLESLDKKVIREKTNNNEIEALSNAYERMLKRLNDAMLKEKTQANLQLQAQYDILQAQINPHFIYNVLNVISYRGAMIDDEVICDMCFNLAEMLRYSTNTKERQSTIEEEVEYLKRYLYLLKQRYQHKLEYIIDMDASVANQVIPKVVLQSLVENSINHGFNNVDKIMEISIKGWSEKGWWYISIEDNGQGFSETTKVKLLEKMKEVKDIIKNVDQNLELEIGGMGLINSYGRLLLLYEDDFTFEISSNKEGTRITIGSIIKGNED